MAIISETVYRVRCDKCGTYLYHIFDDVTLQEEIDFHSIDQCKYMMERHGWKKGELGWTQESTFCICPDCQKEYWKENNNG